ncbi:putative uncharacterized protein DDB_G0289963 [Colias croceus]|uniref:putative uncharacterized protein DDB_G0289963 n=1 Tax=Colias crocea TaxID=72248 RepID=UPI001E27DFE2|nr:putative uncharacterized protein DDB_G0289963 [Colias croceus]
MNITTRSNINDKCNEVENENNDIIPNLDSSINSTTTQQNDCDHLNVNKTTFEELKAAKNSVIKENEGKISQKTTHKTTGHKSNSLRKKRFAPAVYNYVTNHDVDSTEKLEPEGVVNTANLANFNIKTTHEPFKSDTLKDTYIKHIPRNIPVEESASDELKELSSNNKRSSQEIDESSESVDSSGSKEIDRHNESSERNNESTANSYENRLPNSQEKSSNENLEYHNSDNDRKISRPFLHNSDETYNDSNESKEAVKNLKPLAFKHNINKDDSDETTENSNSEENIKREQNNAKFKNHDSSNLDENLKIEDNDDAYNQSNFTQNYKNTIGENIDESTEQISKENISTENESGNANSKVFDKNDSYENSPIDSNIHSNDTTSGNLKTIVNINDGEVKPVIEQNIEDDSSESSEELKSSHLKVDNPQEQKDGDVENKKVDLKQQFERIPLDYKHVEAESNEQTESPISNNDSVGEKNKEVASDPPPGNEKFDDNLNIKFGDISIKLPDIKLPDDILSFNYEDPLYEKVKSENSYSHKEPDQRKINNNYDYRDNFSQNYKNKDASHSTDEEEEEENDDDDDDDKNDDEDLYEKFVRERFGKRKSKEEKKSKYITPNAELYKTLQNVLKKTEKIQQEAEKSGDPNAGYAWTLEYGQKL